MPPVSDDEDDDKTRIVSRPPVAPSAQDIAEDAERTQFEAHPSANTPDPNNAPPPSASGLPAADVPPLDPPVGVAPVKPQSTALGIGTTINNNYRIDQVLKSGGMGAVYRGVEIGTGDPVAIKAILPELAEDEKAGLMFKREARTLRQLAHEAIVRYYNYVHDRDLDQYFLVMEFIEGIPLSDHIKEHGALPVPAVLTLLKRLSGGLAKAHEQGVTHRDLSPDNVMLPGGDVSQARLIDFGIAKSTVVTEGTTHGQFAGKYKYVAPEQLGGGEVSSPADIYGLALLTAAAAIGTPLDMGSSIVVAVQSRLTIPDLSAVPMALRPILSHMLEPDETRRPASMELVGRMVDHPELIPPAYREGMGFFPAETTGSGQFTAPPHGLQMPTAGLTQRSIYPSTISPQTVAPSAGASAEPEPSGPSKALGLLVGSFVAISAAVGVGAWQMGMFGEAPPLPESGIDIEAQTAGMPGRRTNTRAGFLAEFDAGRCILLARVPAGRNAGMIEVFSPTGEELAGLPVAYEEKFGARPAILPRQITPDQCAALEFTHALQGRGREAPRIEMTRDEMISGQAMTVRIGDIGRQAVWAALITPSGALFNLTERLSDPVGGQRSLNFGLNLAKGSEAVPQLVLIVASDSPLARTATAGDGIPAAELLALVLEEVSNRKGAASASLGYVRLLPPEG
ncbi:serine/threonine protein kinase [Sulfitobacter sp. M57]|nr:serine/threonine protein kinase [Sulfitobacter sp. KE5]MDF3423627.1 serine/threonine protein kinase [Sulfitobacter sp. KE43]MDF3434571.1 serine/threonine protein kinase [Sulfitobacter sp. KE42]MDF3460333.1 serine/threonine protein kinase [Sulfitobacter sp. S74]MDF3464109.1 serine/threonine protein kinase [Sulfitobacter sp. Ks18]MDF3468218.1 serine/threonine protein kinase [Sulfitobacter sp. M05]MDF3471904.1 serine/threonine protein kinase [Sulfitobacter sp. M28]MDF3475653.1 serine/threoni